MRPTVAAVQAQTVRRTVDNPVRVGVGLVVALLLLIAGLTYRNTHQLNDDAGWVAHTHDVLNLTSAVMLALVDAETGQRGFLITGKDEFLQPYDAALLRLGGRMAKLKDKSKDDSAQQARITKLEALTAERLGYMRQGIDLRRTNAEEASAFVAAGKGKSEMDAVRRHVADIEKVEHDLLEDRARKTATTYRVAVATGLLTAVFGLVTVGAFVWLLRRNVSARQQAAAVLLEQREWFRATLASIGDGVIATDTMGRVILLNKAAQTLSGWTQDEAAGQPITAVLSIVSERTREVVPNPALLSLRESRVVEPANHSVLIARDGTERPIEDTAAAIRLENRDALGAVMVFRDVSERRQAETALREIDERYRAATAAVSDLIWTNNADGLMTGEQTGWGEFTGQSREAYQGYGWSKAVHPEDAQPTIEAWNRAVAEKRTFVFEHRVRRRDGEWRVCSIRAVPILNAHGMIREWVGVHTDITERKHDEERLRQFAADLSEADRRKDEFLATLAHELRNPLAPIRNGLQLMKLADGRAAIVEQARSMMERQLTQMVRLVDDLMDVSRISRGKLELRKERIPLATVLNSAVETSRPLIEQMGHELTVTLPNESVFVDADLTRLAQVFVNLLNNAAKYGDRGGHIGLTAERHASEVFVTVKDTGIGIAADQLPHIFEMFTQLDRSLEKSHGGLGIGLTLVRRLVEMHGGSVEATSEGPDKGSEFVVRLPVVVEPSRPQALGREAPQLVQSSHRILVVDDNRDGADSLAEVLRAMGNDTRTAYDGQAGVDSAAEFRPTMVLCDIGLPKLNGYDACRRIREQPWGKGVVLIAVTGWGQDEDRRRSHDAGFDHHLVKPVDPQALMTMLAGLDGARPG